MRLQKYLRISKLLVMYGIIKLYIGILKIRLFMITISIPKKYREELGI